MSWRRGWPYAAALEAARRSSIASHATLLAIASARVATKLRRVATQQPLAIAAMTVACGEDPLSGAASAALGKSAAGTPPTFFGGLRDCATADEEASIVGYFETVRECFRLYRHGGSRRPGDGLRRKVRVRFYSRATNLLP